MNMDRTARTGTEAGDGVTHYAGGTANAFARALAYEVGRGAEVYAVTFGAVFVEWKASGFRLAIEVDANGWFHVMQALDECREDYENMSIMRAADVARGWWDMFATSHVNGDDYIRHLESGEPEVRVVESTLSPEQEAKAQAAVAESIAYTAAGGRLYTQEEAEAFVKAKRDGLFVSLSRGEFARLVASPPEGLAEAVREGEASASMAFGGAADGASQASVRLMTVAIDRDTGEVLSVSEAAGERRPDPHHEELADLRRQVAYRQLEAIVDHLQRRLAASERQVHRLIHGEEIESDRICDHELAYTNLRQACATTGLDPDELGRKHAEWIRNGAG